MNKMYMRYMLPKKQFIISAIIFIICLGVSFGLFQKGKQLSIDPPITKLLMPGTQTLNLQEKGRYTIYLMLNTTYEGVNYKAPETLKGLAVSLKQGETQIKVERADLKYISKKDAEKREAYLNFNIQEAGKYQLTANLKNENSSKFILAVGLKNNNMLNVFYYTVGASLIGLIGIFEFIGYMLYRVIKFVRYYNFIKSITN